MNPDNEDLRSTLTDLVIIAVLLAIAMTVGTLLCH